VKSPQECESLGDVREAVDVLDREIVALLGRRSRYVEKAAEFKTSEASVRAPERQRAMLAERRRWAEEEGLDGDFVEALYRAIVAHFVEREKTAFRESRRTTSGVPAPSGALTTNIPDSTHL
jgi:isochorismate pyruvate lyase